MQIHSETRPSVRDYSNNEYKSINPEEDSDLSLALDFEYEQTICLLQN